MRVKNLARDFPHFEFEDKLSLSEGSIDKRWRCYYRKILKKKKKKSLEADMDNVQEEKGQRHS